MHGARRLRYHGDMARLACMAVVLAGCHFGGGPMLGYRGGRMTSGWEMGAGFGADGTVGFQTDLGQSWRAGRPMTFAVGTLQRIEHTDGAHRFSGFGGSFGFAGGEGDYKVAGGFVPFVGADTQPGGCSEGVLTTIFFGLRFFGRQPEVFVTPRIDYHTGGNCPVFDEPGFLE